MDDKYVIILYSLDVTLVTVVYTSLKNFVKNPMLFQESTFQLTTLSIVVTCQVRFVLILQGEVLCETLEVVGLNKQLLPFGRKNMHG